jgi:putative membrane protein
MTRRPRWVFDAGDEPDPRFTLANERTFLAWTRTSLGMIAGAVALHTLELPDTGWVRRVLVLALLVGGVLSASLSYLRWAMAERAMRLKQPMPGFGSGLVLTTLLVALGIFLAVALTV